MNENSKYHGQSVTTTNTKANKILGQYTLPLITYIHHD